MVGLWAAEKKHFRSGIFPGPTATPVIWRMWPRHPDGVALLPGGGLRARPWPQRRFPRLPLCRGRQCDRRAALLIRREAGGAAAPAPPFVRRRSRRFPSAARHRIYGTWRAWAPPPPGNRVGAAFAREIFLMIVLGRIPGPAGSIVVTMGWLRSAWARAMAACAFSACSWFSGKMAEPIQGADIVALPVELGRIVHVEEDVEQQNHSRARPDHR